MPTAFRYPATGRRARLVKTARKLRIDLLPDVTARRFIEGLTEGDPTAERFVAETYHGDLGARNARKLVEKAHADRIDTVEDAPDSIRELFAEFEQRPDWLDPDLLEEGAAVWRRWAYALGALGNAGTNDTYTEGWLAVPLSLSGGYAGDRALHRYLETSKWWIEVCRPGALLTPNSAARNISLHVRIMHVSVRDRDRVKQHAEWDAERWGLPISQSAMLLTLLGESVAPALGLLRARPPHLTARDARRPALQPLLRPPRQRPLRRLLPETVADAWRILFLADSARSYDSAANGAELVESFVPAFEPTPHTAASND